MRNSIILLLLTIQMFSFGQDFAAWTAEELDQCNTAKNENYLTLEEKKVIQLINLTRLDGQKFSKAIVQPYVNANSSTTFTKSLLKDLKIVKNYPLLLPEKELFKIAENHATNMGNKGKVGHDKFEQRVNPIRNKYYGVFENCDYGFDDALTIVMRLLIDEGIAGLGHRKAILNPAIFFVGTSIKPHKKWKHNCVQIFAGKLM